MELPNLPTFIPERILALPQTREASSIQPIGEQHTFPDFEVANKIIRQLWEIGKYQYNDAYKIGTSYHGLEFDAPYIELISAVLNLIFTSLKEQLSKNITDIVERQKQLIIINSIQKITQANLDLLKNFDLQNIDKNIILATLSGYINNLTGITVEKFKK